MAETSIEWCDKTWNPVVGCSVISPGCTNCYAMKMAGRLERMGSPIYKGLTQKTKAGDVWTGKVEMSNWGQVTAPLRWKKPARIFVNSMSDLFHENLPDEAIDKVFAVMALCPQHTFMVLTKRSGRMREYMNDPAMRCRIGAAVRLLAPKNSTPYPTLYGGSIAESDPVHPWPLPQIWLGVSTEDQPRADERVPDLLATPAAVRFVSAEPLLGPVDFASIDDGAAHREVPKREWGPLDSKDSPPSLWWDSLTGKRTIMHGGATGDWSREDARLDMIIAGSESGHRARPCDIEWVRSIKNQCVSAGVAFFYKQAATANGKKLPMPELDGRTWDQFPEVKL